MRSTTRTRSIRLSAVIFAGVLAYGCAGDSEPPVATPSVTLDRDSVALGGPLEATYRFSVAPTAPEFAEDYRVFVHFLDADEGLMWAADHDPAVPTSQWKPGQTISYTRQMLLPVYPYIGEASVAIGLYSPTTPDRLPLAGEHLGQRAYRVATLELLPQSESVFLIYRGGSYPPEYHPNDTGVEWQWTQQEATISFRNPKQDSRFYLHFDGRPDLFGDDPPQVAIVIGDQTVDGFAVESTAPTLREILLSADDLGTNGIVDLKIQVDKTFTPAEIPGAGSQDDRELGLRVFDTFIEPQ